MSTENVSNEETSPATAAVSVKLPEFWKNDPSLWFSQAEIQFLLAGVHKDETKFYHIVAKLEQSVLCHIADYVKQPPATGKYEAVKQRLISRFELTEQAKMDQLLGSYDFGDLRPTHLLTKMQELAAGLNVNDSLLKRLFLQKLPANIRAILSIHDGSLSKLAEMADKMIEMAPQTSVIHASVQKETTENLAEEVAAMKVELRQMKARQPERGRLRSTSQNRSNENICWYHRKYGNRATRCRSPCQYHQSKN